MFSDPLVAVMTMLILFFAGMVVMVLFLARTIASLREDVQESMRKQQMYLSDMEQQLLQINFTLRPPQGGGDAGKASAAQKPPGDIPLLRQEDPLLSMLEATARKKTASPEFEDQLLPPPSKRKNAASLEFDDQLLPPPPKGWPQTGEYDPANDPNLFDEAFLSPPGKRADRLKRGG